MSRLKVLVFGVLLLNIGNLVAQATEEAEVPAGPVDLQGVFMEMVNESHNYNNYEMIKEPVLAKFWKVVTDSVTRMKATISDLSNTQDRLEKEITALNETITVQREEIESLKTKIDEFSFVGISMTKSSMSVLFWVVTLVLIGVAVFCVMLFFRANSVASTKVKNFNELQDEFTEYQKTMKERETTLRREFQTVQNKLWDLEKKIK